MLKQAALSLCAAAPLLAFHVAEININEKDFEGALKFDMGQFNETLMPDTMFFGFSYIKGSEDHSDVDDTEGLVGASFLMQRPLGAHDALTLGMGLKYHYTKIGDVGFSAIPIGMELKYALPVDIAMPLYVGGTFYYSPEVLSFDEAKNYIEYRAYADAEVIERGHLVVGYRNIDTNFDAADVDYNHSWYFGFRFQF